MVDYDENKDNICNVLDGTYFSIIYGKNGDYQ